MMRRMIIQDKQYNKNIYITVKEQHNKNKLINNINNENNIYEGEKT